MTQVTFDEDIKPIFANYVGCMKNVVLSDESGTENLDLSNYDIVKRFYYQIQVAIHGYDFENNKPRPGANPLQVKEGKDKGQYVVAPHPMPPRRDPNQDPRLAQKDIDLYDQWVDGGMLENKTLEPA